MGAKKRMKDFAPDATVADTDGFPVDSTVDGTRFILAPNVRSYMQTGISLAGYETTAAHDADISAVNAAIAAKMANPMTSPADLIVGGAAGAPARLAKGTALQVLRVNAGATALEYATPSGGAPEARVLAINTMKVDVTSGTSTVAFLSYTVDRTPSDWISAGIIYRGVLTGRCANTSGAQRTLDIAMSFDGTAIITVRLPIAVTVSPNLIPWTSEFFVSCPGDDLLWINGTAYLGAPFNGTTGLVDTGGAVYAGSKQTGSITTTSTPSLVLAMTYKRDSTVSTFTTTFANAFIQQIKV